MTAPRVVVVGAGIAGVACARAALGAGLSVTVLDRGRVIGGRMASPTVGDRPVDCGASYLTARSAAFQAVVDDWVARGVARPWTDRFPVVDASLPTPSLEEAKPGPVRYGAPGGLRHLVADLAERGDVEVTQSRVVRTVGPGPTVDGISADAVVLAMPDPQALRVLDPSLAAERAAVAGRPWSPVLALLAGFERRCWPDIGGAFVHGDPTLEWIADDGSRHGDGAPVLVAHSTAAFARSRLTMPSEAAGELVAALRRLLGTDEPSWTKVHRWTYAKPDAARETPYHLGPAMVGLAGCGWGSPRVETAWASGNGLGLALAAQLS